MHNPLYCVRVQTEYEWNIVNLCRARCFLSRCIQWILSLITLINKTLVYNAEVLGIQNKTITCFLSLFTCGSRKFTGGGRSESYFREFLYVNLIDLNFIFQRGRGRGKSLTPLRYAHGYLLKSVRLKNGKCMFKSCMNLDSTSSISWKNWSSHTFILTRF